MLMEGSSLRDLVLRWMFARLGHHRSTTFCILVGLGSAVAAALLRAALQPVIEGAPFITFFPAVVLAGAFSGGRGALASLAASIVLAVMFWLPTHGEVTVTLHSATSLIVFIVMAGLIAALTSILHDLLRRVREAEEQASALAREMRHRLNNLLAIVQVLARQSFPDSPAREEFASRLQAIARAQDVVIQCGDAGRPPRLKLLLKAALEPFDRGGIAKQGEDAEIEAREAANLSLVIYELATNSLKHGALSVPGGTVTLTWAPRGKFIRLVWKERHGPPALPPASAGFGVKLIQRSFPRDDALPSLAFESNGVTCTMDVLRS